MYLNYLYCWILNSRLLLKLQVDESVLFPDCRTISVTSESNIGCNHYQLLESDTVLLQELCKCGRSEKYGGNFNQREISRVTDKLEEITDL